MTIDSAQHHQIEVLAYELWEKRGRPFGSPEEDWFRAQAAVNREQQEQDVPLCAMRFGPCEE